MTDSIEIPTVDLWVFDHDDLKKLFVRRSLSFVMKTRCLLSVRSVVVLVKSLKA